MSLYHTGSAFKKSTFGGLIKVLMLAALAYFITNADFESAPAQEIRLMHSRELAKAESSSLDVAKDDLNIMVEIN